MKDRTQIFDGGLAVDDRGETVFVNEFNFEGVKRFYMVSNHKAGFVRAWHAHRHEAKYITAVSGEAIVGAVKIDNWEKPPKDLPVERYVISSKKPQVIYVPAGYANGFMSLTSDLKLMFFSTSTLEESAKDDIRYDARYWDIWNVIER
ncbi:MAG: dTDP-4-dehydrorhamnose 3,5-epimerase family protein [Planctomycetota bacterium]|jgi:dTDP-4-dehydrorhamnose 3,5-epimerase